MSDNIDIRDLDLSAKVEVGRHIKGGGFSDIYEGTVKDQAQKVAIKSLRMKGRVGPKTKERLIKRFYREALLWRKLQHPNVVPLLGYMFLLNGDPVLICNWYKNGNVIDYLVSYPNPNPNRKALALDVVNGMDYLHSFPVVHGDLKGENILVDEHGHASLGDFGMSWFIDEANSVAGLMASTAGIGGSDRFMSPELLENKPKTIATDIWALGCLIMQILTGIEPYRQFITRETVIAAITRGEPPVANNMEGLVGGSLGNCIRKCWSVEQFHRPKAYELGKYLTAQDVEAPRLFRVTGNRYSTRVLWNSKLSPSFGNLTSMIHKIDDITKVAIIGAVKAVLRIKQEERHWVLVVETFNKSALLKQRGKEHENRDTYTNHATASLRVDSGVNQAIMVGVQGWFERLIDDSDILEATQIKIDDIKMIVATTGRAIGKLDALNGRDENYREISIVEFGVIRYPQPEDPYFKLYSIELFAWASYQGLFKGTNNGIKGVFSKRTYQPNEDIIKKMRAEVLDRSIVEAENLLFDDD